MMMIVYLGDGGVACVALGSFSSSHSLTRWIRAAIIMLSMNIHGPRISARARESEWKPKIDSRAESQTLFKALVSISIFFEK